MPALVIKFNPLTYYNNNSTKEKYPNLHYYINLNNNSSFFFFLNSCYYIQNQHVPELVKVKPLTFIIIFPLKKIIQTWHVKKRVKIVIRKIIIKSTTWDHNWATQQSLIYSKRKLEVLATYGKYHATIDFSS